MNGSAVSLPSRLQHNEHDDTDVDSDDDGDVVRNSLDSLLSEVTSSGSFATTGTCSNGPIPGLSVEGIGLIGLPLTEHTAKAIVSGCHLAPYGQGSETIVNEAVRKTWELDPDRFEFQNPEWEAHMQGIAREAANGLGYPPEAVVRAEMYKLLLYEEGAMFKAHQDTEKTNGMFATLVISLPSKHEGGDVIARHHGVTKRYATANGSAYQQKYIAWYADVIHEVLPVTSGYRLVVVYNLIQTSPGPRQTAAKLLGEKDEMKKVLAAWNRGIKKGNTNLPDFLVYQLDYEYTDASLSIQSLKGLDKVKADCLKESCAEANVGFYLASSEKKESGPCEGSGHGYNPYDDGDSSDNEDTDHHPLEDVVESSLELKRLVDIDGTLLARDIALSEDDYIQSDAFEDRSPDKEDYEGYMGNWGPDATHFYHDSVAVLVPFSSRSTWLQSEIYQRKVDINAWIQHLNNDIDRGGVVSPDIQEDLYKLSSLALDCHAQSQSLSARSRDNSSVFPMLDVRWPIITAILLNRRDLFEQCLRTQLPLSNEDFAGIGKGLGHFKLDVEPSLSSIRALLDRRRTFHETFNATVHILNGFQKYLLADNRSLDDLDRDDLMRLKKLPDWRESYLYERLELAKPTTRQDGTSLAKMAMFHANDGALIRILTIVKRNPDSFAVLTAFVSKLQADYSVEKLIEKGAKDELDSLVEDLCHGFALECQQTGIKRDRSGNETSSIEPLVGSEDVALLLHQLCQQERWVLHQALLDRLTPSLKSIPVEALSAFFIPLLMQLATQLRAHPGQIHRYRDLIYLIIRAYKVRYVQSKPANGNLACSPVGCDYCSDCRKLDAFLGSRTKEIERFSVGKAKRHHLHELLNDTRHSHETDRSTYPETLVVKKAPSKAQRVFKAWEARCVEAERVLGAMDQDMLKQILTVHYESSVDVSDLSKPGESGQGRSVPTGRAVEVIDLT